MKFQSIENSLKKLLVVVLSTAIFQCFSQNYNRFYDQGQIEFNKKNFYQAAKLFEESHTMIPDVSAITYKLAESLYFAHSYERALDYFTEVITKSPGKFPMAYFYQAELQKTLKQYSDAMSSYKYYNHFFTENTEYNIKSQKQILSCDFAMKNNVLSATAVRKLSAPINTMFSEINIAEFGDSVLLYSALSPNNDSTEFPAKMFFNKHVYIYESLIRNINEMKLDVIDLSISTDQKTAFFCACTDTIGSKDFKIYSCVFDSMKWKKPELCPEQINLDGYRSTQPYFTKIGGKDYLFFVSDRPGGQGNLDIWCSQWLYNRFLKPVNLGNTVNTIGEDVTPFYDTVSSTLYFSSELHKGYGGFDIFSSTGVPGNWSEPKNLGLPINSSFNEVYFSISQNKKRSYFTSDRDPIKIDGSNYYFNDFYYFNNTFDSTKIELKKDSLLAKVPISVTASSKQILALNESISINSQVASSTNTYGIYFDHNQPEINANSDYEALLSQYLKILESKSKDFSVLQIQKSFSEFTDRLKSFIPFVKKGVKIEIQLKAFTSPTGNQLYNTQLAQRRVDIVIHFIETYKSGILKSGIKITILPPEVPVSKDVSENEGIQMASQRKVEIKFIQQK